MLKIDDVTSDTFNQLMLLKTLEFMEFFDIIDIKDVDSIDEMPEYTSKFVTSLKIDNEALQTFNNSFMYATDGVARALANALDVELIRLFSSDNAEVWYSEYPWDNCNADIIGDVTQTEIKEGMDVILYYPLRLYASVRTPSLLQLHNNDDIQIYLKNAIRTNDIEINMNGAIKLNYTGNAFLFKGKYGKLYVNTSTEKVISDDAETTQITMWYNIMPYERTHVKYVGVCKV